MEIPQFGVTDAVPAAVLRAVGQEGPVRSNRSGDQRAQSGLAPLRLIPKLVPGLNRKLHGAAHQARGFRALQAAARKACERRLIGRGRGHVGAGLEVIQVHGSNHLRSFDQILGRPQRIEQISAAAFEFGGQRTVEDHDGAGGEKEFKRIAHCAAEIR